MGDMGEIEVTPEMIEAGLSVLTDDYPQTVLGDAQDRRLIQRIFSVMDGVKTGRLIKYEPNKFDEEPE